MPFVAEPRLAPAGKVQVQAGGSTLAPVAGDTKAITDARSAIATSDPSAPSATHDATLRTVAAGAAVSYAARPGVAPLLRLSTPFGASFEGTLLLSPRDAGFGLRYLAYESRTEQGGATTFTIGVVGRALVPAAPDEGRIGGANVSLGRSRGYGGVVPVVLSWLSDAGYLNAYVAGAVGYDAVLATVTLPTIDPIARDLSVHRLFGTAAIGLGVGLRGFRVIAELGLERDLLGGALGAYDVDVKLWSLVPAFAVSMRL